MSYFQVLSKNTEMAPRDKKKLTEAQIEKMGVVELRRKLKSKGFKTTGLKDELIRRLKNVSFPIQVFNQKQVCINLTANIDFLIISS